MLARCLLQRGGFAQTQRRCPIPPALAPVSPLQGHEQQVVIEPPGLLHTPSLQGCPLIGRTAGQKAGMRTAQPLQPPRHDGLEVHPPSALGHGRILELAVVDPARPHQRLEGHHQWAARKSRHALVRRVTGADRRGGKPLPNRLPSRLQPIHEAVGIRAKVADAMGAWQRGDVQQDAAGALGQVHGSFDPAWVHSACSTQTLRAGKVTVPLSTEETWDCGELSAVASDSFVTPTPALTSVESSTQRHAPSSLRWAS